MAVFATIKSAIEKGTVSAINRAARSALSRIETFITGVYAIKKKDLDKQAKIIKAQYGKTSSKIIVSEEAIGIYKFRARQTRRGVTASVRKGDRKLYRSKDDSRGSFISKMVKSGHYGVFLRMQDEITYYEHMYQTKKGITVKKYKGEKIRELFGVSAMRLFKSDLVQSSIRGEFSDRFKVELEREMKYRLNK